LNGRGRHAAAQMALALAGLGLIPQHVLVSTARRTLETWAAIEHIAPEAEVRRVDDLYLAPPDQILDAVRAVPDSVECLMVIGHNPGLHELALSLTGPVGMIQAGATAQVLSVGYPTAALAEFEVGGAWWDLAAGGARLTRFLLPKDLPETAG